jgi:hypothetical protein
MSVASIPFVIDDQELERQELALAPVGAARLTGLVSLAWHLRQRDGRRAGELSQQAREMIAQRDADPQQARSTALRLTLVDAEVCWLLADYGTALRLASAAVEAAQQMGDGAIGADAHWIRAQVASDLGDTALRDISLQACEGLAQRLDDPNARSLPAPPSPAGPSLPIRSRRANGGRPSSPTTRGPGRSGWPPGCTISSAILRSRTATTARRRCTGCACTTMPSRPGSGNVP